jgi:monovalent cation:H+ antiporter, CPA1 family
MHPALKWIAVAAPPLHAPAMHDMIMTVFGLTLLLGLVSLLLPLAERLSFPYAVILALVGIALGTIASLGAGAAPGTVFGDVLSTLDKFQPSAETLLAVFLPPLLFEAALNLDVRQLSDEIGPVLLLAVVGVVLCTFAAGLALWPISELGLVAALALGAIIATTDPVAVVGIFRDVGAPRRLSTLVEGESLFNDAAAIAIFTVAVDIIVEHRGGALSGVLIFLRQFLGGVVVGALAGWAAVRMMPLLRGNRLAEATMTIASAYIVYVVADHYLGLSGIVAVAAEAIAISAAGRRRMAPANFESLIEIWEQLAFWASSLIFLLAAMEAPDQLHHIGDKWLADLGLLVVLIAAAMAARGITLFGLMPVLSVTGMAEPIGNKYKAVMLWGGLRGAVSLALAAAAAENHALPPEVGVLAIGFVLFTLLVNAPTLRPLMRLLQLNRLSPSEAALRDRVIALSRSSVREEIGKIADAHEIDPAVVAEVGRVYRHDAEAADLTAADDAADGLRTRTALLTLADREQQLYAEYLQAGIITRGGAATLLCYGARLRDAARTEGVSGYERAAAVFVGFGRSFRTANLLHRKLGLTDPLAKALAARFEVLHSARSALREAIKFNEEHIRALFGERASQNLAELLEQRLGDVERAVAALRLQYPTYAHQLQVQFLVRTAAQLEADRYEQLREESILNRDVFDDLERDLTERRRVLEARPTLDLGLNREELIGRVPLFSSLDENARRSVARLLRPRLAVPGEFVVRKGERGDAMYFISSGAVEVRLAAMPVELGSGDFFGELALLEHGPRTADVVALGYCQLLSLAARDLDRLFEAEPTIRDEIHAVARTRLSAVSAAQG